MWLKRFDLFPKVNAESRRTTSEGGVITIIGVIIGVILFINETFKFAQCSDLALDVSTAAEDDVQKLASGWSVRSEKHTPILQNDEGCAVEAVVDIKGYQSGEMHVALSTHATLSGQLGITFDEYFHYNASHQITAISVTEASYDAGFSETHPVPENRPSTMFDKKFVPEGGTGRYVYDFNVVPERYKSRDGNERVSFLIQCREQDVITRNPQEAIFALQRLGLPGVFMTMHLSTLMIDKVESSMSWGEYVIIVLGIIAGTSTTVAFVDSLLHETFWKAKLD